MTSCAFILLSIINWQEVKALVYLKAEVWAWTGNLVKPTNEEAATRLEETIFGAGHNRVTTDKKGAADSSAAPGFFW